MRFPRYWLTASATPLIQRYVLRAQPEAAQRSVLRPAQELDLNLRSCAAALKIGAAIAICGYIAFVRAGRPITQNGLVGEDIELNLRIAKISHIRFRN